MVEKYFGGKLPEVGSRESVVGSSGCKVLNDKVAALAGELDKTIPRLDFAAALMKIWEVIGIANKLIEDSKPWALAKEDKTEELASLLSNLMNALKAVADSVYPFMPTTSENIKKQLVKKSTPLFPRIESK